MEFLEALSGSGTVYDGDKKIADVVYEIKVFQKRIDTSSHDGNSTIPGLKTVVLHLQPPIGATRDKLTLVLKDGRKMQFYVLGYDNFAPTGPIA